MELWRFVYDLHQQLLSQPDPHRFQTNSQLTGTLHPRLILTLPFQRIMSRRNFPVSLHFLQRKRLSGVFSRMVIKPGAKMLEICCGDGFNARHFYSSAASSIIALDFDKDAIPHARRYNSAPNITYVQQDIREGLPAGPFDNIVWDAAIEHFTETEIDKIMRELVGLLGTDGILSGYTLTEAKDGKKSNALHEYEFKDKEDLRRFFTPHFTHVRVWETIYPTRHNLYFAASQSPIEVFS